MTQMGTKLLADIWPTLQAEGAVTSATYKQITAGTLTSTSIFSTSLGGSTFSTGIEMLLSDFKTVEIDGVQIQRGDRRARFPQSILSITPDQDDRVVISGSTYRVMGVDKPTDGATWSLQLRKP